MLSETLSQPLQTNNYVEPLARHFLGAVRARFNGVLPNLPSGAWLRGFEDWSCSSSGIVAPIDGSVLELSRTPHFFSRVLKPIAVALESACRELTEAFTSMNCGEVYEVLRKTEQGPLGPDELNRIREIPAIRPLADIVETFRGKCWHEELLNALLPLVLARCAPVSGGSPAPVWRKGFGYALVFSGPARGECGAMRILPVAHIGPAGVVEAHGIFLERMRNDAPLAELQRKGIAYQALGRRLAAEFAGRVDIGNTAVANPEIGPIDSVVGSRTPLRTGAIE